MEIGPKEFELEYSTVWSFPERGKWATHNSKYRGNFSPYIPRNVILRYSNPSDLVLDQMCGSGTTLVECKLLGRNAVGYDISKNAVEVSKNNLDFKFENKCEQNASIGDARKIELSDESVDLIVTHPPYLDIIKYEPENPKNISNIKDVEIFFKEIRKIANESYRVLKKGKFCAILVGDTRKGRMYVPLAYKVMHEFMGAGFKLKEDIIKKQWNCSSTNFWKKQSEKYNFLLIMHEHLFIFKKI